MAGSRLLVLWACIVAATASPARIVEEFVEKSSQSGKSAVVVLAGSGAPPNAAKLEDLRQTLEGLCVSSMCNSAGAHKCDALPKSVVHIIGFAKDVEQSILLLDGRIRCVDGDLGFDFDCHRLVFVVWIPPLTESLSTLDYLKPVDFDYAVAEVRGRYPDAKTLLSRPSEYLRLQINKASIRFDIEALRENSGGSIVSSNDSSFAAFVRSQGFLGQRRAVSQIGSALEAVRKGLKEAESGPLVFLLLGPAGSGKTFLARLIAKSFLNSNDLSVNENDGSYVFVDMVNYQDSSTDGFVDPSPGLQGTGVLSKTVNVNKAVVVLDEIEKGNESLITSMLLPMLAGKLTFKKSSKSQSTHNWVVVLTSNCFSEEIAKIPQEQFRERIFLNSSVPCGLKRNMFASSRPLTRRLEAGSQYARNSDGFFLFQNVESIESLVKLRVDALSKDYGNRRIVHELLITPRATRAWVKSLKRSLNHAPSAADVGVFVRREVHGLLLDFEGGELLKTHTVVLVERPTGDVGVRAFDALFREVGVTSGGVTSGGVTSGGGVKSGGDAPRAESKPDDQGGPALEQAIERDYEKLLKLAFAVALALSLALFALKMLATAFAVAKFLALASAIATATLLLLMPKEFGAWVLNRILERIDPKIAVACGVVSYVWLTRSDGVSAEIERLKKDKRELKIRYERQLMLVCFKVWAASKRRPKPPVRPPRPDFAAAS